jgi:phage terminase large subunit-like protein
LPSFSFEVDNCGQAQPRTLCKIRLKDLAREHIHAVGIDPVGDKIMRMNNQTSHIEAGAVFLPRRAPWLDEFRRELCPFPGGRYNDQVDAFSQALGRAVRTPPSNQGRHRAGLGVTLLPRWADLGEPFRCRMPARDVAAKQ